MNIQNYNDEELVVYNFYKSNNLSKPIDISEKKNLLKKLIYYQIMKNFITNV